MKQQTDNFGSVAPYLKLVFLAAFALEAEQGPPRHCEVYIAFSIMRKGRTFRSWGDREAG